MVGPVAVETVLTSLRDARLVPVVVIDDAGMASDVAAALMAGGIHCAEITLRTPAGLQAIANIAGTAGFTLGAGTVLSVTDVDACVDAGAQFIVSPGFDREVVEHALERGAAAVPGIATASEIQAAMRVGLDSVKLFPADRVGGLDMITSLAGPFPTLTFMPSGGVGPHNAVEYLAHPSVFAVSGSWMASRSAIAARDFDGIRQRSAAAMQLIGLGA